MTAVTGPGRWPGTDPLEAQTVVVGDLTELPDELVGMPFAVHLPDRGPWGDLPGLTAAALTDLPVELGAHGWKLADRPGADLARAQSQRREALDALAVAAHGYVGPLVVPALGPVTLAASLYLARGDRVVGDPGALRELTDSLADGLAEHLAALGRAVPGAVPTVLLHEPLVAAAITGVLPSFSGYSALRGITTPVASARLSTVVARLHEAGARVALHAGASRAALGLALESHADAAAVLVGDLDPGGWENVASAVERGLALWADLPPSPVSQCAGPDVGTRADVLVRSWRSVGLPFAGLRDVVLLTWSSAATPDEARGELASVVASARVVAERAEQ